MHDADRPVRLRRQPRSARATSSASIEIVQQHDRSRRGERRRADQVQHQGDSFSSRAHAAKAAAAKPPVAGAAADSRSAAGLLSAIRRHAPRYALGSNHDDGPQSRKTAVVCAGRRVRRCWRSPACGAFYYYYEMPVQAEDMAARQTQLAALQARHRQRAGDREEAAGVPRRGRRSRGAARQPARGAAGREGRRRSAAPHADRGDAVEPDDQELQAGADGHQAAARRVADQPRARGTYHNLAIFFDRVGKFTRIVNITGLDVQGQGPAATRTRRSPRTCVATTFVLLDKPAPRQTGREAAAAAGEAGDIAMNAIARRLADAVAASPAPGCRRPRAPPASAGAAPPQRRRPPRRKRLQPHRHRRPENYTYQPRRAARSVPEPARHRRRSRGRRRGAATGPRA